ncbi:GNAT family N-acetyltransferase [Actinomadura parmotrematis]|uniref:GNAT family N-acetyltransferase n=1 Tax=Actinomadura parmotrematis TaxID=2864039 RepID=A0ABS7G4S4_9ACTN|nr:GNAT family N-acetyltransferase [Actinomadura parmotrematis]MBW8487531.1 GNAT family N-acetyltransferase [Actinomadura parmotrematis]
MTPAEGEAMTTVGAARAEDVPELAGVLARAFHDDPVWAWILPDEGTRGRRLAAVFAILLEHVHLPHGATEAAGRGGGAEACALWDPPGAWKVPFGTQFRHAVPLLRGLGTRLPAALRALGAIEAEHPAEPHWFLALLGTDPPAQGHGLGGALLRSRLERCDADGTPAYLESSKPDNVPYYERFGFRVTRELPLPGKGAPPVWLMWRAPHAG